MPWNPYDSLQKKNGHIKFRKFAKGNKQPTYDGYDKSAGSSPTVTTRGLMFTMVIDAHKGQDVATVDIETAFLHAENDKEIIMKLRGKMVESLMQLKPSMCQ